MFNKTNITRTIPLFLTLSTRNIMELHNNTFSRENTLSDIIFKRCTLIFPDKFSYLIILSFAVKAYQTCVKDSIIYKSMLWSQQNYITKVNTSLVEIWRVKMVSTRESANS